MNLGQLQVLTSYSLLQSTNEIPNLVSKSKQLGYKSLAITDVNTMHDVIEFYNTNPGDKQVTRQEKVFKIDENGELWTKNQGKLKDYYSSIEFAKKIRVLAYAGL